MDRDSLLARVRSRERLSPAEGLAIYSDLDTATLALAATVVRERYSDPRIVTYLVDRNVNYTNVCITDCKFCEFYRPPGHAESYVLTRTDMHQKLAELVAVGGTRVLLQGGHNPDLRLRYYEELFRWIGAEFPTLELDALSPSEVEHIALLEGMSLEAVVDRLVSSGLRGIPGGGGEILDDEIRAKVSPKKIKTAAWLRVMEIAHERRLYTSASQVFGFGEEPIHRLRALEALRAQQDRSLARFGHGFMAFIAWPLQYESRYGEVFGKMKGWKLGGDAEDYLRHIAFCRVYLDNIPHFQASWPTMGLEVAGRALHHGCDDLGGTMMEENVVSQAGSVHACAPAESLVRVAKSAGFEARQRDSWYRALSPTA